MNDHNHDEPRLDETPAVYIMNVSYCIGRMEVPIRRGIDSSSHRSKLEAADNTRDRERVCGQKAAYDAPADRCGEGCFSGVSGGDDAGAWGR